MKSIGHRLTVTYILISLVTVLIMETLFFLAVSNYYKTGMEQTLINHAEASAAMYDKYAPSGDMEDKKEFIYENMDLGEDSLVEVWGTKKDFYINSLGNDTHPTMITPDYEQALREETTAYWMGRLDTKEPVLSVSTPIHDKGQTVGVLRYVSSMTTAHAVMRSNLFSAIIIGILILIIAGIIGFITANRILIPIKDLIRVTKEISAGNLNVKARKYYPDEIGQLSDVINMMTKELRRSNQSKNDFISSVSHELRTPLTSIKGWAETMEDADDDVEIQKMGLDIIGRETNRLILLVNDLLDFSKLQSHRMELQCEKLEVTTFLMEIARQFAIRAKKENVTLAIKIEFQDAVIYADKNRLKQVIINILDNAFKFVSKSKDPSIRIHALKLEDQISISVEDNGPGMTTQELLHVKEKFYKGSNKMSGTGLGLSIANEIISLHQGNFYIDSIRGVGTRVTIILPYFIGEEFEDFILQFERQQTNRNHEYSEED